MNSVRPSFQFQRRGGAMIQLIIAVAVVGLLLAWLIPMTRMARDRAGMIGCRENLRRLGVAFGQYAAGNHGEFPISPTIQNPQTALISVLTSTSGANPRDFYCPSEKDPDLVYTPDHLRAGDIDYYYYSALSPGDTRSLGRLLRENFPWPRKLNAAWPANTWVMSDIWRSGEPTAHQGYRKGLNYLMLDGSVAFITESPRKSFH